MQPNHAQSVWASHLQRQLDTIENVQMKATELVDELGKMDYDERLKNCDLTTILFKHIQRDIFDMWKHFHVYNKDILPSSFIPNERTVCNGKHENQFLPTIPTDSWRWIT